MAYRKIMFLMPMLTTLITVVNSSAFVFLVADQQLAQYISASSIVSLIIWFTHWIIPSIYSFQEKSLPEIRQAQFAVTAIGVVILNVFVPGAIAAAFATLLLVECGFFHSALLIIYSKKEKFYILEFSRGILNVLNLALCVLFFKGSPVYLVCGMVINVAIVGAVSYRSGNVAATVAAAPISKRAITQTVGAALRSANTRLMLFSRAFEITVILTLTHLEVLSMVVAVKLAVMVGQALSLNARDVPASYISFISGCFLAAVLVTLFQVESFWPNLLPTSLAAITWGDLLVAIIFQIPFTWLLCKSLQSRSI